jgi:hypothetical protein
METSRHADMETWRMETWRMETWRMETWRHEYIETARHGEWRRHGNTETWRHGDLDMESSKKSRIGNPR